MSLPPAPSGKVYVHTDQRHVQDNTKQLHVNGHTDRDGYMGVNGECFGDLHRVKTLCEQYRVQRLLNDGYVSALRA